MGMKGSPPRTSCNHSSKETRPNILWNQVLTIGTTTNAQLCEAMQDLHKMRIACGEPQSPTHYRHVGSVTKGNPRNGNLGIKPLIVSKVTFKPEKIPLNGKPKPPPPKGLTSTRPQLLKVLVLLDHYLQNIGVLLHRHLEKGPILQHHHQNPPWPIGKGSNLLPLTIDMRSTMTNIRFMNQNILINNRMAFAMIKIR